MARKTHDEGVPIQQVLDANPSWVRADFGDLTELSESMQANGQRAKILLGGDFEVIDGARRLHAAIKLGWLTIGAVSTNEWDTIKTHLVATRKLTVAEGLPHLPMTWLQIGDLHMRVLRPYLNEVKTRRAHETRRAGASRGSSGVAYNSQAIVDMAEITDLEPNVLRYAVSTKGLVDRAYRLGTEAGDEAMRQVELSQQLGFTPTHACARIRDIIARREVHFVAPTQLSRTQVKQANDQLAVLRRAVEVLTTVAREVKALGPLEVGVSNVDAAEIHKMLRGPLSTLGSARQMLNLRATSSITTEGEK